MEIVIDASVGVKWFNIEGENYIYQALEIQKQKLSNKIDIIVPDLFLLEIINAFLAKSKFDIKEVFIIEEALHRMNLELIFPNHHLLNNAIKIANAANLTIYDSLYVAVAQVYETLLITDDKKILANKKNFNFIKSLGEFEVFI